MVPSYQKIEFGRMGICSWEGLDLQVSEVDRALTEVQLPWQRNHKALTSQQWFGNHPSVNLNINRKGRNVKRM